MIIVGWVTVRDPLLESLENASDLREGASGCECHVYSLRDRVEAWGNDPEGEGIPLKRWRRADG
jgi:hypothetical protein